MRSLASALVSIGIVCLLALPSGVSAAATGRISGAIFTTLEDGSRVNANHYLDKRDAYLDGGPGANAPSSAAGLPDGNYYFQVTDPSGKILLSSDPVKCREFSVADGKINGYLGIGRTYTVGGEIRQCYQDGWEYGMHDLGYDTGRGAITIQLMPYQDTPNKGGVYKVWATMVGQFVGDANNVDNRCGNGCFHGFVAGYSKTDNFKAQYNGNFVAPTLIVRKFYDINRNGYWDCEEPEIGVDMLIDNGDCLDAPNNGGWPVTVSDRNGIASNGFTPYLYVAGISGKYTVEEDMIPGWQVTGAYVDGKFMGATQKVNINVVYKSGETHTVIFGNIECLDP